MKKLTRIRPLMSEAFIIWLVRIGYRGVRHSSGDTHFYCEVVNKNFPRGVVIMANGKLNKIERDSLTPLESQRYKWHSAIDLRCPYVYR